MALIEKICLMSALHLKYIKVVPKLQHAAICTFWGNVRDFLKNFYIFSYIQYVHVADEIVSVTMSQLLIHTVTFVNICNLNERRAPFHLYLPVWRKTLYNLIWPCRSVSLGFKCLINLDFIDILAKCKLFSSLDASNTDDDALMWYWKLVGWNG